MWRKFFSGYFLITWLAVSFSAGLMWLDHFRTYESNAAVLVLEKKSAGNALETLSELSKNLSFYETVLARNDVLDDPFAGSTPDTRKAGWQDMVTVKKEDGSAVLSVRAYGENQEQAALWVRETMATLFETVSRYYNVKTDLDVRITDGPITHPVVRHWPLLIFYSLLSGLMVSGFFFWFLKTIENFTAYEKTAHKISRQPEIYITADTFQPSTPPYWKERKEEPLSEMKLPLETFSLPEREEAPLQPVSPLISKAVAPANLPILEETEEGTPLMGAMARLVKEDINATTRAQATEPLFGDGGIIVPKTEEPDQSEYKRRLNELLSGKM